MARIGWIKSYRQVLDNPIVCKDAEHFAVWMYLLHEATHEKCKGVFKGKSITLLPGQLLTGRKSIASQFNIAESKVQRILKLFENEHQIEQQMSNKNRLVTINNWSRYQEDEQQDEQQVNINCTTSERQLNTNKNVINKECNKDNTLDEFFDKLWSIYPRKVGKGKVSVSKKKKLYSIGYDELERCVERYTRRIEMERIDNQFVMHGSTFFNSGYVDYLDKNYKAEQQPLPFTETEEETVLDLWEDD